VQPRWVAFQTRVVWSRQSCLAVESSRALGGPSSVLPPRVSAQSMPVSGRSHSFSPVSDVGCIFLSPCYCTTAPSIRVSPFLPLFTFIPLCSCFHPLHPRQLGRCVCHGCITPVACLCVQVSVSSHGSKCSMRVSL